MIYRSPVGSVIDLVFLSLIFLLNLSFAATYVLALVMVELLPISIDR